MDLKQLAYFVRVAELGSFTRAAVVLGVAQPVLSRQVRLLEVELRQVLLLRNGRGVSATDAGKLLLEHGRGILRQVDLAHEAMERARGVPVGQVALGLPPSLARLLAVPLMRAFRERFPEGSLSMREGLSATMEEALAAGRLDLALLYNAAATPEVEVEPLLEEALFLVSARGARAPAAARPLPLRELAQLPLVIPSRPHAIRMQVEAEMANRGLHPRIALEVDGISAIHDLVADGAGAAVLTTSAVHTFGRPRAFTVRRIVQPELRCRVVVAASTRRPASLLQRAVVELLREMAARYVPRTP